jgi:hypothetical protein
MTPGGSGATGGEATGGGAAGAGADSVGPEAGVTGADRGRSDVKGGSGPAGAAGGITGPTGPAGAAAGAAVVDEPAAGDTGGGPDGAPAVEGICGGGGDDTGGGSNGAPPPPLAPSPAFNPREKSFGVVGSGVCGGVTPAAGLVSPGLSGGADDIPDGTPVEGMLGDGKLRPLDGPLVRGIDGAAVGVVGLGAAGGP